MQCSFRILLKHALWCDFTLFTERFRLFTELELRQFGVPVAPITLLLLRLEKRVVCPLTADR